MSADETREAAAPTHSAELAQNFDPAQDPTPESTDAFCSACLSLMVEDNGAGYLCPVCDVHPLSDCGMAFPCSGYPGLREIDPCVLNRPLGSAVTPPTQTPSGGGA